MTVQCDFKNLIPSSNGMPTMKLSDTFLRNIKTTGKIQKYADGGGMYLYVAPTGGKLWRMD
jgi:hypothetical protein